MVVGVVVVVAWLCVTHTHTSRPTPLVVMQLDVRCDLPLKALLETRVLITCYGSMPCLRACMYVCVSVGSRVIPPGSWTAGLQSSSTHS